MAYKEAADITSIVPKADAVHQVFTQDGSDFNEITVPTQCLAVHFQIKSSNTNLPSGVSGWYNNMIVIGRDYSGNNMQILLGNNNRMWFRGGKTEAWKELAFKSDLQTAAATAITLDDIERIILPESKEERIAALNAVKEEKKALADSISAQELQSEKDALLADMQARKAQNSGQSGSLESGTVGTNPVVDPKQNQ